MREIKFRAWDGYLKQMIYSHEPILFNKVIPLCFNAPKAQFESSTGLSSYYLMQYTGFKDCNGAEIYESMEVDGRYEVGYMDARYILINISNGDIIDLHIYMRKKNGQVKVTREYTKI